VQLQAAIGEAETTNDEMKSAIEEYQSANEELQSANEELETSKEELQSINEELQTLNTELNSKNDTLMRLNSDIQNLLESTQIATIFLDNEMRIKEFTPTMTQLFRLRASDRGRPIADIVTRLAVGDFRDDIEKVMRELSVAEREVQVAGDGAAYVMRIRPYRTIEGAVDGVVITFVDITERKKAENVLAEHAAIVEFTQDAMIGLTFDGYVRSWNPAAARLYGYSAKIAVGQPISFLAADGGTDEQAALLKQARSGKVAGPIETVQRRRDGREVDVEVTVVPIRADDDAVVGIAVVARDIAERRHGEAHRITLMRELSHRVKNTLSTVQSIAMQTLQSTPTPQTFQDAFVARLLALSNTHDLLMHSEWQGAELRDLVAAEMAPYRIDRHTRWKIEGADIQLDPKMALALSMAFHELATNAAKYGALSSSGGRVEVSWQSAESEIGPRLRVRWVESGGPAVAKPTRKGFGTRLISDGLAQELDGSVQLDFDPAGVQCTIDVPLSPPEAQT
jgi:two-component system, chemotaxis family, CheB/CheR fusion protein